MMYAISLAALVVVFIIATIRPINMGILAFVAVLLVGDLVSVMFAGVRECWRRKQWWRCGSARPRPGAGS